MEFSRPRRRRRWWRWIAGFTTLSFAAVLLIGFVASLQKPPPAVVLPALPVPTEDAGQPPMAFTYFYYWYDLPSGAHSGALTDRPAEPDASYRSVSWFRKQLTDMNDAGIDAALAVYWGGAEPSSDTGLVNMATAAAQLRQEGREPPRIAMFFDTGLVGRWPKGQRDFTDPENQRRFYSLVHTFYALLPRDQWALVANRPVLWMWASWFDISFDQSFFDYVSGRFENDFGVRPYIVAEASWWFETKVGDGGVNPKRPIKIDNFYVWGAALDGFRDVGTGVASVGPGYDERQLDGPGRSGRFAGREGGRFYERNFESALKSGRRLLVLETWNEFHEASDIADSTQYGRMYIDLTRRLISQFKAKYAIR
ncbi:MAG: DUF5010 domain-containing protein [Chloroflexi bacterium]|nr:DUF5010 domain-containing protein [Chloroflexota bacterium]